MKMILGDNRFPIRQLQENFSFRFLQFKMKLGDDFFPPASNPETPISLSVMQFWRLTLEDSPGWTS